ncbi:hypothetical protein N9O57_01770, partial [bacterium]|nr:hypothetical protein [bacterium]
YQGNQACVATKEELDGSDVCPSAVDCMNSTEVSLRKDQQYKDSSYYSERGGTDAFNFINR